MSEYKKTVTSCDCCEKEIEHRHDTYGGGFPASYHWHEVIIRGDHKHFCSVECLIDYYTKELET